MYNRKNSGTNLVLAGISKVQKLQTLNSGIDLGTLTDVGRILLAPLPLALKLIWQYHVPTNFQAANLSEDHPSTY